MGYSPWGHKKLDKIEHACMCAHACGGMHTRMHTHTHTASAKIFHLQILLSFQGLTLPCSRTIRHMNHLKTLLIVLESIKLV